ncbi:cAMP-regulated D2 protein-like isoform X2 [Physella acuta]|nr:cAMP-regulated D2 protein-like isoform X2 [Physella acuta]XP_059172187.1 cAMP-regulated D2 protein-like isoform X2 [Physella acuta]
MGTANVQSKQVTDFKGNRGRATCLVATAVALVMIATLYAWLPVLLRRATQQATTPKLNATMRNISREPHDIVEIQTKLGSIRGLQYQNIRVFHGIPYARPPVGPLRWKPPESHRPWSPNVYDATYSRPGCPQKCNVAMFCPVETSEDCLHLEIYSPVSAGPDKTLPVMVYIHGGGFNEMSASSSLFDARNLALTAGIVVVLFNYRLGVFGFLVTGNNTLDARGNYGLLDQKLALEWVQEHIQVFGGDPNRVTLAGQSAGAQSLLIHLTSGSTRHLFHSVIIESPPLVVPYKTLSEASEQGAGLARGLGCQTTPTQSLMECLREKPEDDVMLAERALPSDDTDIFDKIEPWRPVVDDKMVTLQPMEALKAYSTSPANDKPMIWGTTTDEGLAYVYKAFPSRLAEPMYAMAMTLAFSDLPDDFSSLYPVDDPIDVRETMVTIATDFIFRCPVNHVVGQLARDNPSIWLYTWDHAVNAEPPPELPECKGRVCHSTEIPFVFQSFLAISFNASADDYRASNDIIRYYSNFMHHNNPNGNMSHTSPTFVYWPHWSENTTDGSASEKRLLFVNNSTKAVSVEKDAHCVMWDKRGYFLNTSPGMGFFK